MDLNLISWELRKKLGVPTCDGAEGPCQGIGKRRRQSTAYHEEEDNWVRMCDRCFELQEKYWEERWAEYYDAVDPRRSPSNSF